MRRLTLQAAGAVSLDMYRRFVRRDAIGYFYHVVADEPVAHVRHLYPHKSTAEFEQDLIYIRRHFVPVSYDDLLAHSIGQRPLPQNAAFLSFDDGFVECFTVVRPLLRKYDMPCMFFVPTAFIDNERLFYRSKVSLCMEKLRALSPGEANRLLPPVARLLEAPTPHADACVRRLDDLQQTDEITIDRVCALLCIDVGGILRDGRPFLTRAQLRVLNDDGFTVGAHSCRHARLATLPIEEQAAEIVESCRIVQELTRADSVPFAFPFSGEGLDRDFLADVRARHPFVGLLFDTKHIHRDRPFVFNRIWADRPVAGVAPEQNIRYWLHDAYRQNLADNLSRVPRRWRY